MKNLEVLEKFLIGEGGKTPVRTIKCGICSYKDSTLAIRQREQEDVGSISILYNYSTPIAMLWQDLDFVYIDMTHYSKTSSCIQNKLFKLAQETSLRVEVVKNGDNDALMKFINTYYDIL